MVETTCDVFRCNLFVFDDFREHPHHVPAELHGHLIVPHHGRQCGNGRLAVVLGPRPADRRTTEARFLVDRNAIMVAPRNEQAVYPRGRRSQNLSRRYDHEGPTEP